MNSQQEKQVLFLHDGWKFRDKSDKNIYKATVPGCVHTDLLNNDLINDPFYRDNESTLQWIGEKDWVYSNTFTVGSDIINRESRISSIQGDHKNLSDRSI